MFSRANSQVDFNYCSLSNLLVASINLVVCHFFVLSLRLQKFKFLVGFSIHSFMFLYTRSNGVTMEALLRHLRLPRKSVSLKNT